MKVKIFDESHEKDLEDAIKNADANDIIEFNPTKTITTKIDINFKLYLIYTNFHIELD